MSDKPYEPEAFAKQFYKPPPDVLYHYTGQTGLAGIVENEELWATKIQYMNDATEFGLALRLAREWLENIMSTSKHSSEKSACAQLMRTLEGLEDINILAICFCERGDLLSQWRGYSRGNFGYSLGFNTDALMQIGSGDGFTLGPCIYDSKVQHEIIQQAIAHCINNELAIPSKTNWGFHGPLADLLFRCGVFFKDASFEDEKEWRLISSTVLFHNEKMKFRSGSSMITPYYKLPLKHDDGLAIRQIIVGPCPHMALAKAAVTSLLMRHGNTAPLQGQQIALGSAIPFRNW